MHNPMAIKAYYKRRDTVISFAKTTMESIHVHFSFIFIQVFTLRRNPADNDDDV